LLLDLDDVGCWPGNLANSPAFFLFQGTIMKEISLFPPRLKGVLIFWHLSENGGFGKIFVPDNVQQIFFLHRKLINSGVPIPGSTVEFIPIPAAPNKVLPQASEAAIDNTRIVRAMKIDAGGVA
jgi:hypothetical protein